MGLGPNRLSNGKHTVQDDFVRKGGTWVDFALLGPIAGQPCMIQV